MSEMIAILGGRRMQTVRCDPDFLEVHSTLRQHWTSWPLTERERGERVERKREPDRERQRERERERESERERDGDGDCPWNLFRFGVFSVAPRLFGSTDTSGGKPCLQPWKSVVLAETSLARMPTNSNSSMLNFGFSNA